MAIRASSNVVTLSGLTVKRSADGSACGFAYATTPLVGCVNGSSVPPVAGTRRMRGAPHVDRAIGFPRGTGHERRRLGNRHGHAAGQRQLLERAPRETRARLTADRK